MILRSHNHSVGSLVSHRRPSRTIGTRAIHENCFILDQARLVAGPDGLMASVLRRHVVGVVLGFLSVGIQADHGADVATAHVNRLHHCVGVGASHGVARSGLIHKRLVWILHVLVRHHAAVGHWLSVHLRSHDAVSLHDCLSLIVKCILSSRWLLLLLVLPSLGTLGNIWSIYAINFDVLGRQALSASLSIDFQVVGVLGYFACCVVVIGSIVDSN